MTTHKMTFVRREERLDGVSLEREYRGYRITKEFFADGPSLYCYAVTKRGTPWYRALNTLREAKAWIDEREGT